MAAGPGARWRAQRRAHARNRRYGKLHLLQRAAPVQAHQRANKNLLHPPRKSEAPTYGRETRRVQLVRGEGRDVSSQYGRGGGRKSTLRSVDFLTRGRQLCKAALGGRQRSPGANKPRGLEEGYGRVTRMGKGREGGGHPTECLVPPAPAHSLKQHFGLLRPRSPLR